MRRAAPLLLLAALMAAGCGVHAVTPHAPAPTTAVQTPPSIAITALYVLFWLLVLILIGIIFVPVMWLVGIAWLVLTVIGAIKASDGKLYRYPATIRFIR